MAEVQYFGQESAKAVLADVWPTIDRLRLVLRHIYGQTTSDRSTCVSAKDFVYALNVFGHS
jgi:hypothetical protein